MKSKSSKSQTPDIATIFGQPVTTQPAFFRMKDLYGLSEEMPDIEEEGHWLRFGLTGEPMESFCLNDLIDDGLLQAHWLSLKLRKSSVYFDTETD
jgi:hypothetical protein